MTIEVLVRWSNFKVAETDAQEQYLKRITGNEQGIDEQKIEVSYEYSPMVLDTKDIARFNQANDPNFTTVRFYDGESFVIKVPYLHFRDQFSELTGRAIMSFLEGDSSSKNIIENL